MFASQNDGEDMVECPYNKAHRMLRKRLQPHIIKCRQSYPDAELQKCPFNQTHLIPEPEFVHHVTNCPDRKLITQYMYDLPEPKEEERVKHEPVECEENWDDTEVQDYDPKKYIQTANVLRRPDASQPAQRKAFIKKERKRLQSLGGSVGGGDGDDFIERRDFRSSVKRELPDTDEHDYKRPRPPTPPSTSIAEWRREERKGRVSYSRSPSPTPSYKRRHYSDFHEDLQRYRERTAYTHLNSPPHSRDRSPLQPSLLNRRSPSPTPPPPPPSVPRNLALEDPYDLDDDPYYNGGSSSSTTREDNYSTSSSSSRSRHLVEDRHYAQAPNYYRAYPGISPYGRGAHRGHPDRRYPSYGRFDY